MRHNFFHWRHGLLFALISAGCASIETADGDALRMGSSEFREYAEQVFRLQNRVSDALAELLDGREGRADATYARLEAADDALFDACAGLNEVAVRRRDQQPRRLFADARVARTVPGCERAALAAVALLDSPEVSSN